MDIRGIELIRDALAVYRLSLLLVHEDGPYDIFIKLRANAGIAYNVERGRNEADNVVGKALTCMKCTSLWVALFMPFLPNRIKNALALSAAAIWVVIYESKY